MTACLACGLEGNDRAVRMTVVEYDDPIEVQVAITTVRKEPNRPGYTQPELEYRRVPGRYGAETRCVDVTACKDRQAAMTAPVAPPAHAEPATEAWFE